MSVAIILWLVVLPALPQVSGAPPRQPGRGNDTTADKEVLSALKKADELASKDPQAATRLLDALAKKYRGGKEYANAIAVERRTLALQERIHGPSHPAVGDRVEALAWLRYRQAEHLQARKRHVEAAAEFEEVLQLYVRRWGEDHLATANALNALANAYCLAGQHAKAEPSALRSLRIREAKLGKDHVDIARSLELLALVYTATGRYSKVLPLADELARKDPQAATRLLDALAKKHRARKEYAKAIAVERRALALQERIHGSRHPTVGDRVEALAWLRYRQAEQLQARWRYVEAAAEFEKVLRLYVRRWGKDHLEIANALNTLAIAYHLGGQYAKEEPLCLRSLAIREAKLGKDDPRVAEALNNLAGLYRSIDQCAKAEPLFLRSLAIWEAKRGKDHPETARILANLATLYEWTGQYAKAEPLLRRSLAIWEAKLGKDHPDTAWILGNLATLYQSMGQYAKAEPLYRRSLAIYEAKLGKDHPDVANSMMNLGILYHRMGQYAKAEPLYLRSAALYEAKLGKDHPYLALNLNNLAWMYRSMGKQSEAWPYALQAAEVLLRSRSRASHTAVGKMSFYGKSGHMGSAAVCLALKLGKSVDALELLERHRARGLRELLAEAKAQAAGVLGEDDGKRVLAALAKINALTAAIDRQAAKGAPVAKTRETLRRAEREYDQLLAEVGREHRQFVAAELARGVKSAEIVRSAALDDATAIVGWVASGELHWGYVLRTTGVKWVDLSKGPDAKARAQVMRRLISATRTAAPDRPAPADLYDVYRTCVLPLEPHLQGVRKLIVIAQDWSAQLPVELLLTDKPPAGLAMANWPWLARKYQVSYAPSATTLDILSKQRTARKDRKWPVTFFALADPPFSAKQLARMKTETDLLAVEVLASAAGADRGASTLTRLLGFDLKATPRRLPGTRREVRLIAGLFGGDQATLLLGPAASERRLAEAAKTGKLKRYRYVHLATHGFVNDDRPEFSGLVLARAPVDSEYDGILHMREVFGLKLDADLVVLSACQTGLGKQLSGEGMLGLSTAFFFAGAQSIVMSLWNVPDAPTALLMWRFYGHLKAGKTKSAALHAAKAWLRNLTVDALKKLGAGEESTLGILSRGLGKEIESKKGRLIPASKKPFAHPHYWAGFVLTGDPE